MAQTVKYEDYLASIYYDPKRAAAYGGVDKLYRAVRKEGKFVLGRAKIRNWLLKQEDYAVHRGERGKFKRRRVVAPYVDYQWDVDTANMELYKKDNDGYAYFLLAVDILSKFVWTEPLRARTGKETARAFQRIFEKGRQPNNIRSDKGTEFANKDVKRFLKGEGVRYFVTQNIVKASYAERAIKTVKSRIARYLTRNQSHRWIDVLPAITDSYNQTYHRSIKRTPASVKKEDSVELWKLQYQSKSDKTESIKSYKFKVGDLVRVSFARRPFQREYDERWSRELFVVNSRFMRENIPQYQLKDYSGDIVSGNFYQNQMIKAHERETYLIEKVLRSRGKGNRKNYLVRWKGWAPKFDSWISEKDLTVLNTEGTDPATSQSS